MSRVKLRSTMDICADCGSPDPGWASINRGVLICDECCSVHRSLGRHVSQVKSLKKGSWSSLQLAMVHALSSSGANSIWEHSLLDPANAKSGRRKPQPKDPVHPIKADFIRAKHQMLAFVYRLGRDEKGGGGGAGGGGGDSLESGDISRQLHSSVRTCNLETSLRLLSLGADPNYFYAEKGTSTLHVAAKAGQASQVELLIVYGADITATDNEGKTPADYARSAGHMDICERLQECQYELTDRLSFYLCGRKPDHANGQHFLIPEMADSLDLSDFAKAARKKLQALSNPLFEELAMDVYDEVDRRETDAIWLSMQNQSALVADRCAVPFLPVNPELTSTRNQGRQKLARFNARELATLIIDILSDARRRANCSTNGSLQSTNREVSITSDEEPLYDSVASDEDYVSTAEQQSLRSEEISPEEEKKGLCSSEMKIDAKEEAERRERYESLRHQLAFSEAQVQSLIQSNSDMKQEIALLQRMVHQLMQENADLRGSLQHAGLVGTPGSTAPPSLLNGHESGLIEPLRATSSPRSSSASGTSSVPAQTHQHARPASMYETREGPRGSNWKAGGKWTDQQLSPSSPLGDLMLPDKKVVFGKTEKITRCIQSLLIAAQEGRHCDFMPCVDNIRAAVNDMVAIFPQAPRDERVRSFLRQLLSSAVRLQVECSTLLSPTQPQQQQHRPDYPFIAQQLIQCAYDIAKAAKQIVGLYQ